MADTTVTDDAEQLRPRPAVHDKLALTVAKMPAPVFAILDGGHFDDLGSTLAGAGLSARSLFLGHGDRDVERFGPWFAPLRDAGEVNTVLAITGDLPAVVFWSCPEGDVALYGHLRRLNQVRLPVWAAAGKAGPDPGVAADLGYETVLFRHWDPRVLGTLLPVLDEAQFSRIMGPAAEICFVAPDHGGLKRVIADAAWPPASPGIMVLRPEQVGDVTDRLASARRHRLRLYLRDVTGPALDGLPDRAVDEHVRYSERTAKELGIVTEAGQCRWTYLVWATRGTVVGNPVIAGVVRQPGCDPDRQLAGLMRAAAETLRTQQPGRLG